MASILIVEDEESIRMALEDDLGLEGYEVASANDGLQGLAMAKEKGYDLIILAVNYLCLLLKQAFSPEQISFVADYPLGGLFEGVASQFSNNIFT